MATDPTLKPAGLFTDPNPVSAVPPGAMREADNVVIRRDGIVEPRPGFKKTLLVDGGSVADTADVTRAIPWKTSALTYDATGEATFHLIEFGGTAQNAPYQLTGAVGTDFVARAVEARENLYVCAADGVRKYIDVTDDVPAETAAGDTVGFLSQGTAGTPGFLTDGYVVSYRVTLKKRDANKTVVESVPSYRVTIQNASGSSRNTQFDVLLPSVAEAYDQILVYRSVEATIAAGSDDELFLAITYVLTSSDITAGSVSLVDDTDEASLGAALYTNVSQEGTLQANTPLPKASDMAYFRGSLWLANIQARKSAVVSWEANAQSDDLAGDATGIGRRIISGTSSFASATITGVADTSGIEQGMLLYAASGNGADFVSGGNLAYVVSKTVNTITFSATSSAARAPGTFYVMDEWQMPGDDSFIAWTPLTLVLAINYGTVDGIQYSRTGNPSTLYTAALLSSYNGTSADGTGSVGIYERRPGALAGAGEPFVLNASKYAEYEPGLSLWGTTSAVDDAYVDDGIDINGLLYSKTDQPEAMPYPANLIRVGSSSHAIDRVLATKDALWIFKHDGIFRLTGAGADAGWRVDPFDMAHYLIAVDSAVVMDDAIFAWTNRGVVRIADSGVTPISALSIGDDLRVAELYGMSQANEGKPFGAPTSSIMSAGWAIANVKDDEYILAVPEDLVLGEGVSYTVRPYVYNTKTLAWSRWTMRHAITAGAVAGDGRILFGGEDAAGDGCLSVERSELYTGDGAINADWNYDAVGGGATTLDYFATDDAEVYDMQISAPWPDWTPTAGDVLYFNGNPGIITEAADSQNFTIYIVDAVTGDMNEANVREGVACEMEFVAKIAGQPNRDKMWRSGTTLWGSSRLMDRATLSFTSSLISPSVSTTLRADGWPDNDEDVPWMPPFWVPRNHTRAAFLFPKIAISDADSAWQLYGITLTGAESGKAKR